MKSHRDQGRSRPVIIVIVAMTVLLSGQGQRSFSHRIFVDFDSPPRHGVRAGTAVLMNGAEIGRTAKPVLPEEGQPKIRVPVSLERRNRQPSERNHLPGEERRRGQRPGRRAASLALSVSRKEPLVFPGATTDLEYVGLRARQFF